MDQLSPEKLHIETLPGLAPVSVTSPRRYTLTHSDVTGDLFLSIGPHYDTAKLRGWQNRLMRDEVTAVWEFGAEGWALHVHCHVSGGLVLGRAQWRLDTFRRHLPLVLQAFRHGDRQLFQALPQLDKAPVFVHFHARQAHYSSVERWGVLGHYRLHPTPFPAPTTKATGRLKPAAEAA